MKRHIHIALLIALMAGVPVLWLGTEVVTPAAAAGASAGHGHAEEAGHQEEVEALFEDEEDGHEGHGHGEAKEAEEHDGHDGHDGHGDSHAGHGHAEAAKGHDDHEGHDDHGSGESGHEGHGHGSLDGICHEHRVPEAECALCQGGHIGDLSPGQGMKVRLASTEVAGRAGIGLARPQSLSAAAGTDVPGRVAFNRNRLARITPLSSGVVRKVLVRPGAQVRRGDVLAEVAMPEIASLKADLLAAQARVDQSKAAFDRERDLLERGITSRQEFQQADAQYRSAQSALEQYRQQLGNFGLSDGEIATLLGSRSHGAAVAVRAPFDGTVTEMTTAIGEGVDPGAALFTVADLDTLWLELSVPEASVYKASAGAPVEARFDGLPGEVFSGTIFQVGAALDERSRTLKVLAEVKNPGRRLKVGMFGQARLLEGDAERQLAVPADAIQSIDGAPFVFVYLEQDLFDLRRVETGPRQGALVPVRRGLAAGEQVVAAQGFSLKSEVLKARLGASCADH